MLPTTVLVSGYLIRRPVGGLAWHYLHYVLGLLRMGYDVYYVEDSEDYPCCFDPTRHRPTTYGEDRVRATFEVVDKDPSYGLAFAQKVFDKLNAPDRWGYYDAHSTSWRGPAAATIQDAIARAEILLNVSHSIPIRPWMKHIRYRALVDTDPVFAQARHIHAPAWLERALEHNSFVTFGENYGANGCTIPEDGLPWRPTRQPIVLDSWPVSVRPSRRVFTTVMSWKSYQPAKDSGVRFGVKSDSFAPYLTLPKDAPCDLELAIDASPKILDLLREHGWALKEALAVTADPWTYQDYIQQSAGEFSIAKEAYVATRSGWFSERSAAYLASGKPVLAQETGFSDWMRGGEGVIPFDSIESARKGLRDVMNEYDRHAQAARRIANEYFEASLVLRELLANVQDTSPIDPERLPGFGVYRDYSELSAVIHTHVPPDSILILVDENQFGAYGKIAGRTCLPMVERNGVYWGNPSDDDMAISEVERMRRNGGSYLLLARPAFWWFEHYTGFVAHLESSFETIQRTKTFVLYDLRKAR